MYSSRFENTGRRLPQLGTGANRSRMGASLLAAAAMLLFAASAHAQAVKLQVQPVSTPQVAGQPFDIVVKSLNAGNNPTPVLLPRAISLTVQAGSGALTGNIEGVLDALQDTAVLQGVVYDTAETGVVIRASDTFPGNLTAGDSNPIDFLHGDLQIGEVALAVAGPASELSITYSVVTELAAVPSFNINVGVDTDNNGAMDTFLGALTPPTVMLTPGTHTFTADIRSFLNALATKIKHSDNIVVRLDPGDTVKETDESNASNRGVSSDIFVDLQPISLHLTGSTQAELAYNVESVANVEDFTIEFYLDTDPAPIGDGILDTAMDTLVDSFTATSQDPANVEPGGHEVIGDFSASPPATNQLIFAVIDSADVVAEANEDPANTASTANSDETDLQALALHVWRGPGDPAASIYGSFRVMSPTPVPVFNIRVGIDRAPVDGVIDSPTDVLFAAPTAGPLAPGWYAFYVAGALDLDALAIPLKNGDLILMTLDLTQPGGDEGAVDETDEVTSNRSWIAAGVDLLANSVDVTTNTVSGETTADVYYTIQSYGAVAPFNVRIGVDRDGNNEIDSAADVLAVEPVSGSNLQPGPHSVSIPDFRAALNALATPIKHGDQIVATLDLNDAHTPESALLIEAEEVTNNVAAQPQAVDLVAEAISVTIDNVAGTTDAHVTYAINSPANAAPFSLKIGVDRVPADGVIDLGSLLADVAIANPADLTPGSHTVTVTGLRGPLNAQATPVGNGDMILATLDLQLDGTPVNDVAELAEESNNATGQAQTVDLVAQALAVSWDAAATTADVTYTIIAPANVAGFSLKVGIDRAPADGAMEDILDDQFLTGADLVPGTHIITVDIRAALEGLASALQDGDRIVVFLDLDQDGATPEAAVAESNDVGNNVAGQAQTVDLVAGSIAVSTNIETSVTTATVTYTVNSPGPVAPFNLRIGLDRPLFDDIIDVDPTDVIDTIALTGADLAPGTHSVPVPNFRNHLNNTLTPRLQNGDRIIATLDELVAGGDEGAVTEADDTNNVTQEAQTVDLIANGLAVTVDTLSGETTAHVDYTINSIGAVEAFKIRIGVDRNNDGVIDGDNSDLLATVDLAGEPATKLRPGDRNISVPDFRAALTALVTPLEDGDRLVAVLDIAHINQPFENDVTESEEVDNNFAKQRQSLDIVAVSLTFDDNTKTAYLTYAVNAIGGVPPFDIEFFLDTNPVNPPPATDGDGILDGADASVAIQVGADNTPGTHTVSQSFATSKPAWGQFIFARVDSGFTVVEAEEGNNEAQWSNTGKDDLVANQISVASDETTAVATVSYTVNTTEDNVDDFNLRIGVDRAPADGVIDAGDDLSTELLTGVDVEIGAHTRLVDIRAALDALAAGGNGVADGDVIVATLDLTLAGADEAAVLETEETANNITGEVQAVDLVANAVTVTSDNVVNETTAKVAYTINSPSNVGEFDLRLGVDRGPAPDGIIDTPADVITTITLTGADLMPGAHEIDVPDFRGFLNTTLSPRLAHGDQIIATLDVLQDGTPDAAVGEAEETTNNVAVQPQTVDLIANAIAVTTDFVGGTTTARVDYTINSPGAVEPFFIRLGIDSDGDKIIDPGTELALVDLSTEAVGKVRPGDRQVEVPDFRAALDALATPIQDKNRIIATLDQLPDGTPENIVGEPDDALPTADTNNYTRQPQTVDLVAESIFLTIDNAAGTTAATVTYTVNSPGVVAPFNLRIGIDRDADDRIDDADPGDLLWLASLTGADLTPGPHTFFEANIRPVIDALTPPLQSGDRIIATLDFTPGAGGADEGAVNEDEEDTNNVTTMIGTQQQIVDISGDDLTLTVGSYVATVNYTVTSPGNVAPFVIRLGRDTNADDAIDDFLVDIVGDVTPGAHQASEDLAPLLLGLGVLAGENVTIVADIDADGTVVEAEEVANNKLVETAPYLVDLMAVRLTHPCAFLDTVFDVEFDYTVAFNQPSEDFTICVYASDNDAPAIGGGDVLLGCVDVTLPAGKTVGDHTVVIPGVTVNSADFTTGYFFVKARIDDPLAVNEANEGNNVAVRPNAAQDPSEDPDGDGVPNCFDGCPDDPNKLSPGVCGCGVVDDLTDTDGDGILDCLDPDPNDPDNPNPNPNPNPQPVPGAGDGFEIFLPIIPLGPPMCGIGLCGGGTLVPVSVMLIGFVGLRLRTRSRRRH